MIFVKGQPKPPNGGRRKGTPNRNSERERRLIAEGDDKEIVARTIADAKSGDHAARQIYFRYLRPSRPKLNTTPIDVTKPETIEDVRDATGELLVRALAGELDLDAADVASTLLKAMETSIVGFDLAELLNEMKIKAKQSP